MTTMTKTEAERIASKVDMGGFPQWACEFADETGSDVKSDVAALLCGVLSPEGLTEYCLDGADDDRIKGARAYAAGVIACTERARALAL